MAEEEFTSSQFVLFAFVVIYQMFADIPPSRPPSQCPAGVGEKKRKKLYFVFSQHKIRPRWLVLPTFDSKRYAPFHRQIRDDDSVFEGTFSNSTDG